MTFVRENDQGPLFLYVTPFSFFRNPDTFTSLLCPNFMTRHVFNEIGSTKFCSREIEKKKELKSTDQFCTGLQFQFLGQISLLRRHDLRLPLKTSIDRMSDAFRHKRGVNFCPICRTICSSKEAKHES